MSHVQGLNLALSCVHLRKEGLAGVENMRQCSVCQQILQLKVTVLYTFNLREDIMSLYIPGVFVLL